MSEGLPENLMPREKLLQCGSQSLSDTELLALVLRTGVVGTDVINLSDQLLSEFGSIRNLLCATKQHFCAQKGLGEAKYAELHGAMELVRRYLGECLQRGETLRSPEQTKLLLTSLLRERSREAFYVLYLDNQNRMIAHELLFEGTIDSASVHPREVVARSLDMAAAAVMIAHNHPSGVAEPSQADRRITRRLSDALQLVDVRLLDHFVVGDGEVVSFAERGWL